MIFAAEFDFLYNIWGEERLYRWKTEKGLATSSVEREKDRHADTCAFHFHQMKIEICHGDGPDHQTSSLTSIQLTTKYNVIMDPPSLLPI